MSSRTLYALALSTMLLVFSIASLSVAWAEGSGGSVSLPRVQVVVKPYPIRGSVGEHGLFELYLVLDRDLNGSICLDVRVYLDDGGLLLDKPVIEVEGVHAFEISNATDEYCNYAYGEIWGYSDRYIYVHLRAANVSKGVYKFAEIRFVPLEAGKWYMSFVSKIVFLNVTIKCYDDWCYRTLEPLEEEIATGYIPVIVSKVTTEKMAIVASGALLGLGLSLALQPIMQQYHQYQFLIGTLIATASLLVLLYLLGLLAPP